MTLNILLPCCSHYGTVLRDKPRKDLRQFLCRDRVEHLRQHKAGGGEEEGPEDLLCLLVFAEWFQIRRIRKNFSALLKSSIVRWGLMPPYPQLR